MQTPDGVVGNPPFGVPRPCPDCTPRKPALEGGGFLWNVGLGCAKCRKTGVKGADEVATLHLERALEVTRRHVFFLLRLGFLGSRGRVERWPGYHLRKVSVLVPRVPFTQVCRPCGGTGASRFAPTCSACGGTGKKKGRSGTDSAEYACYWFDKAWTGPWSGAHLIWRE